MGADGLFSAHASAAFLDEGTAEFLPAYTFVLGGNPFDALGSEGAMVDALGDAVFLHYLVAMGRPRLPPRHQQFPVVPVPDFQAETVRQQFPECQQNMGVGIAVVAVVDRNIGNHATVDELIPDKLGDQHQASGMG